MTTYMTVHDLDHYQLGDLRDALYYGCPEYDDLTPEQQAEVDAADFPGEISDDIVFAAFEKYSFVEEDFFA